MGIHSTTLVIKLGGKEKAFPIVHVLPKPPASKGAEFESPGLRSAQSGGDLNQNKSSRGSPAG